MKNNFILILMGVALLSGSLFVLHPLSHSVSRTSTEKFEANVTHEIVSILRNPDEVSLFKANAKEFEITLPQEKISTILNLLLDDKSYHFENKKLAVFQPSIGLKFTKNHQELYVYISFQSQQIEIHTNDSKLRLDCDPVIKLLKKEIDQCLS